jgi:hypothetical protein
VQLCVGVRVAPQVVAVTRKGHSLVMRRMVSGAVALLVRVRVWLVDWPEATWPKLRMDWPGIRLPVMANVAEPVPYPSTKPRPLRVAEPSVGVAWAKRVPVMSPLVRGRKVTANWQEALGARAAQGGLERTNWRGRAMSRVRDFAVRLLMVNWRVPPRVASGVGP